MNKKKSTRRKFGKELSNELARAAKPSADVWYSDTEAAGFLLRRMPSGKASYAVRLSSRKIVSLGDIKSWPPDAVAAREAALEARKRHREGKAVTAASVKPAPTVAGDTPIGSIFGIRAAFADNGVEIAGAYRIARGNDKSTVEPVALDYFVRQIGADTPIASVTIADVRAYFAFAAGRKNLKRAGNVKVGRSSLVRHLTVLRCAFAWAKDQQPPLVLANPFDGFKLPKPAKADKDDNKPTRWLRPAEEVRLRAVLAARDRDLLARNRYSLVRRYDGCEYFDHVTPLVLLALNTGGRRGGLHTLRWEHIEDLPYDRVRFEGKLQKAGRTYYVPLNAEARAILARWKPANARPSDLIFPNTIGTPFKDISTAWYTVRVAAGLPDFRFHDLRHTFASKLVQRGISLRAVSLLLGHGSQRQTERYANLAPEHGIDAVDALNMPAKATGIGVAAAPAAAMAPAQLRAVLEAAADRCGVPLEAIAAVFLEHGMSVTTAAPS